MKTATWISALALGIVAHPTTARADGGMYVPPFKLQGKFQFHIRLEMGNANMNLAPWYLYYPADAARQAWPQMPYPNWPAQHAAPTGYPAPQGAPQRPPVQRVGYYYQAAPSYWYGH